MSSMIVDMMSFDSLDDWGTYLGGINNNMQDVQHQQQHQQPPLGSTR